MKPVTKDVTDKAFRNPNCKRNKGFFDGATPDEIEKIKEAGVSYTLPKTSDSEREE